MTTEKTPVNYPALFWRAHSISIEGTTYPSLRAAARFLGCAPDTVKKRLQDPTKNSWGWLTPDGTLSKEPPKKKINKLEVKGLVAAGVFYTSVYAACEALKVDRSTVYRRIARKEKGYFWVKE